MGSVEAIVSAQAQTLSALEARLAAAESTIRALQNSEGEAKNVVNLIA